MSGLYSETTSAHVLASLFEKGQADPREIAEFYLDRAQKLDPAHRVYTYLLPERARSEAAAAAERMKRGLRRHALDGVPLSWKDLFDVTGVPSTAGSLMLQNRIATSDAEMLARASRAGSVCL